MDVVLRMMFPESVLPNMVTGDSSRMLTEKTQKPVVLIKKQLVFC